MDVSAKDVISGQMLWYDQKEPRLVSSGSADCFLSVRLSLLRTSKISRSPESGFVNSPGLQDFTRSLRYLRLSERRDPRQE
jgi:hypothetical protein